MLFKKFVQTLCKIFTISVKNLELLQNSNTIDIGVEENFNVNVYFLFEIVRYKLF